MLALIVRYGIVALAAALAAFSGEEASGCGCRSCGNAAACGERGCGRLTCGGCRKNGCRHTRRKAFGGCCQAALLEAFATAGMGYGFAAPAAAPMFAMPFYPPRRPPVFVPLGTLGRTYHQISRLVPESEHPRTGIIEICDVPAGMQVTIDGMEGYVADNGVWYFRTIHPLLPCTPTIRTAYIASPFGVKHPGPNYRAFRLIPGRIVSMRW